MANKFEGYGKILSKIRGEEKIPYREAQALASKMNTLFKENPEMEWKEAKRLAKEGLNGESTETKKEKKPATKKKENKQAKKEKPADPPAEEKPEEKELSAEDQEDIKKLLEVVEEHTDFRGEKAQAIAREVFDMLSQFPELDASAAFNAVLKKIAKEEGESQEDIPEEISENLQKMKDKVESLTEYEEDEALKIAARILNIQADNPNLQFGAALKMAVQMGDGPVDAPAGGGMGGVQESVQFTETVAEQPQRQPEVKQPKVVRHDTPEVTNEAHSHIKRHGNPALNMATPMSAEFEEPLREYHRNKSSVITCHQLSTQIGISEEEQRGKTMLRFGSVILKRHMTTDLNWSINA